jgi:hypothetical protein
MEVTLIQPPKVITLENLQKYIAECSSVVRNKEPKNAERLWDRLMKESYGGKPSRVMEYIPCKLRDHDIVSMYGQYFGFFNEGYYYTTARELLNWGFSWDKILPTVDFTHYSTVKVIAPYFIYGQLSTHNQITSVSHSNRYTESDLGYWQPNEVKAPAPMWNDMVRNMSPIALEDFMKECGVNRREVFARGSDMLQNRIFCLGGYTNNPNAFPHFINQRMRDPHTQLETRQVTEMISKAINNG